MIAAKEKADPPHPPSDKNGKPLRGKAAPQYIEDGTIIHRFRYMRMIGGGGFGQIYKVINIDDGNLIAAGKVEPQGHDQGRMILELQVLCLMRGTPHFPLLYCSGEFGRFNFIVMELLGRNLTEIRKRLRAKRMSVQSTYKIAIQITEAFEALHSHGYVHRDIKPSNMCVGSGAQAKRIYLVDFGMARRFLSSDGRFRKARNYAAFRGTMRYVSIRVHERHEQDTFAFYGIGRKPGQKFCPCFITVTTKGPCDDFMSLYYTLLELCEGALPWRLVTDHDEILSQKLRYGFDRLANHTPERMRAFHDHITALTHDQMPDYERIYEIFKSILQPGTRADSTFDWDDDDETGY